MKRLLLLFCFLPSLVLSQQKYDVYLPENYDSAIDYPLFIVMHGGNGNKTIMRNFWQSRRMAEEFISVYLEGSTLDNPPDRWGWRDVPGERKNIKSYLDEIRSKYPVDESRIIAGGYSLGGKMSIDMALYNQIPLAGFISLNHGGGTTDLFTDQYLIAAKKRGIRGVIIAGEKDTHYIAESHRIRDTMMSLGFEIIYIENSGVGHTKPADFGSQIDASISFILND